MNSVKKEYLSLSPKSLEIHIRNDKCCSVLNLSFLKIGFRWRSFDLVVLVIALQKLQHLIIQSNEVNGSVTS